MKKLWITNALTENWPGKWFLWTKTLFICIYYNMNKKLVYNIRIFVYIRINLLVTGELWHTNLCFTLTNWNKTCKAGTRKEQELSATTLFSFNLIIFYVYFAINSKKSSTMISFSFRKDHSIQKKLQADLFSVLV